MLVESPVILAARGRTEEAEWAGFELLTLQPDFSIDSWKEAELFTDPSLAERLARDLLPTGLPE